MRIGFISSLVLAAALVAPARADDLAQCTDIKTFMKPADRADLCTQVLKSAGLSQDNRIAALRARGHAYYDVGKSDKAIADHSEIIRLKSDDAEAYYDRGWVTWAERKYKASLKDLDQAIKLKPDYAAAYDTRASSYLLTKQYDRAIA